MLAFSPDTPAVSQLSLSVVPPCSLNVLCETRSFLNQSACVINDCLLWCDLVDSVRMCQCGKRRPRTVGFVGLFLTLRDPNESSACSGSVSGLYWIQLGSCWTVVIVVLRAGRRDWNCHTALSAAATNVSVRNWTRRPRFSRSKARKEDPSPLGVT